MQEQSARHGIRGLVSLPGDKSMAHRALIFTALADGPSRIEGLPGGADVQSTRNCLRRLGVSISDHDETGIVEVAGAGLEGLKVPRGILDCGNSGTTARLLCGLLSAQRFSSTLDGDESLRRRPMARVVDPLRDMGARIDYLGEQNRLPLRIDGGLLPFTLHKPEVASAQVKSSLLLASLAAGSGCRLLEHIPTRNHSELLLAHMGSGLEIRDGLIELPPRSRLRGCGLRLPGDISSAAFLIAIATLLPGSDLCCQGVGINPGRVGFITALREMGADIELNEQRNLSGEPVADIRVRHAALRSISLRGAQIPGIIDELPLLALVASQASGRTEVRDAGELRLKESDRIESTAAMLDALGLQLETSADGFTIDGPQQVQGGNIDSRCDHRIAMSGVVASLLTRELVRVSDMDCIAVSYPGFEQEIARLVH
jgi:3-phosphoshikimate 1-carboxyvinyltransferase